MLRGIMLCGIMLRGIMLLRKNDDEFFTRGRYLSYYIIPLQTHTHI
jgi:hypothetical protein